MRLPKTNRLRCFWLVSIIIFDILDIFTTYINVVVLNGRELNPFINWVIEKIGKTEAILAFLPLYKGIMIVSFWIFLTYLPSANQFFYKFFPTARKMRWLRKLNVKYIRFLAVAGYICAYLVLITRISAVVFNTKGIIYYLLRFQ